MRSSKSETTSNRYQPAEKLYASRVRSPLGRLIVVLWAMSVVSLDVHAGPRPITLMLVRHWNSTTGILTGWLPTHQMLLIFRVITPHTESQFNPNEAVSIVWVQRSKGDTAAADIHISPSPHLFGGKQWLPVVRDANVVRIKNSLFLVDKIVFGDSAG